MEGEESPLGWGLEKTPKLRLPPPDGSRAAHQPPDLPSTGLALLRTGLALGLCRSLVPQGADPTGGAGSPGRRGSVGPAVPTPASLAPPAPWCAGASRCQQLAQPQWQWAHGGSGSNLHSLCIAPCASTTPTPPPACLLSGWKHFIAHSDLWHPPARTPALPHPSARRKVPLMCCSCSRASPLAAHTVCAGTPGVTGQLGAWILPRQPTGHH